MSSILNKQGLMSSVLLPGADEGTGSILSPGAHEQCVLYQQALMSILFSPVGYQ